MRYKLFFAVCLFIFVHNLKAQEDTEDTGTYHFDGRISVTNNGFSLIPTFSLGEPAGIAELSVGGDKFSFDPQFRFDLNGLRPWSFIFIWRYKIIDNDKFYFRLGTHLPAIAFRNETYVVNGVDKDRLVPQRFITPEITASYEIWEDIGVGLYYLYGIGLEKEDQTRNTHFIAINAFFSRIGLSDRLYLEFYPQVYYLTLDGTDGFYASHSIELAHDNLPISIGSMMNFKIDSDIVTDDFQWNISLIYTFENDFILKK